MVNPCTNPVDQRLYEIGMSWSQAHYTPETRLIGTGVRGAAAYALFLAAGGDPADCREAEKIVAAVVEQQQTDPSSAHFGLFKTSSKAETYTDQNWAAFCGSYLMHIPRAYANRIGEGCQKTIQEALMRACAFIKQRDVTPGYTNIALLSASVLTVAGEIYGATDYLEEGRRKMRELVDHINLTGGFQEYSSPTYYGTNLSALCWMGMFVQDEEIHDLALRIQARLWRTVAAHYHAPTGQLAGPHSRSYGNILQDYAAASKYYLYKVLDKRFVLGENVHHGGDTTYAGLAALQDVVCPEDAVAMMVDPDYPRTVEETVRTDGRPLGPGYVGPFVQMTTHLTDAYALGTINTGEVWYQRRNLMLYWVGPGKQPAALTERVRQDDAFTQDRKASVWGVQQEGSALMLHDLSSLSGSTMHAFSVVLTLEGDPVPQVWVSEKELDALPGQFGGESTMFIRSGDVCIGIRFQAMGLQGKRAQGEIRALNPGEIRETDQGRALVLDLYRGEEIAVSDADVNGAFCAYVMEVCEAGSNREAEAFREKFSRGNLTVGAAEGGFSARWRGEDVVLAIQPTGEGGARQYEGVIGGIPVHPERFIKEEI